MFGERISLAIVWVTANYRSLYRRSPFWSVRKTPQFSQRPHMPRTGPSTMDTARDLGHAHVVGSRERCQPRTAADGKSVTESNLSLGAPAQNIRRSAWLAVADRIPNGRARVG